MKSAPTSAKIVATRFSPLALYRMSRELTQSEIARRTAIDRRRLSEIETGLRRPRSREAARIARVLRAPAPIFSRLFTRTLRWAQSR
jgi:transcriptional regulator with XRE-family HTH domain